VRFAMVANSVVTRRRKKSGRFDSGVPVSKAQMSRKAKGFCAESDISIISADRMNDAAEKNRSNGGREQQNFLETTRRRKLFKDFFVSFLVIKFFL